VKIKKHLLGTETESKNWFISKLLIANTVLLTGINCKSTVRFKQQKIYILPQMQNN